jgi:diguanylate cyclase (GGDEF)-like protein/PAS domain S-box-containing protein
MRIRTVLSAAVFASIAMALVLGFVSWMFVERLEASENVRDRAQTSANQMAELLVLTHEYALHPDARVVQQWQTHQVAMLRAIAPEGKADPVMQQALVEAQSLGALFKQLQALDISSDPNLNIRRRQLLLDQSLTKVRLLADANQQWVGVAALAHRHDERQFRAVAVSVPVLMMLMLLLLSLLFQKRVLQPLAKLRRAVANVAKGDLTVRAASLAHDEIGDLSRAFDAMAVDLVSELRQEIAVREQAQVKLTESELRLKTIVESEPECIKIVDEQGLLLHMNPAGLAMIQAENLQQVANLPVVGLLAPEYRSAFNEMHQRVLMGETLELEFEIVGLKGQRKWLQTHAVPMQDAGKTVQLAVTRDITERKKASSEIEHLAFYDSLTNLPNRRLMLDRLGQALNSIVRHKRHGALLLIDLDNFKNLNDSQGHTAGDQLLVEVAARLTSCIRGDDTVARMGSDEFVVILQDLEASGLAPAQAEAVAVKIQKQLNQPYQLGFSAVDGEVTTRQYHCTSSIGITVFVDHGLSTEELLKRADAAMFQAKVGGRNLLQFFDPEMQAIVKANAEMEADLREAVFRNQFLLHYQAQVNVKGDVTGVEALVRWLHPQRGMVSPGQFIPLAETCGLILPIGRWVLEVACSQLKCWSVMPELSDLTIAVNVSARQFHENDFVEQVQEVLASTGANAQRLKLELTESLLVHDLERTIVKMLTLKTLGVGFSLDDFGTGYSSLAYLKRMPLDQLKIDQGFVRDILLDPNDAAIAKMVVALGNTLGLDVIAEGVETQGQRDFLAANGCVAYQGYLFGRPMPVTEFQRDVIRINRASASLQEGAACVASAHPVRAAQDLG